MKRLALLLLMPLSVFGAYSYYYTDTLGSLNATKWTQNGSNSFSAFGYGYQSYSGGSLISSVAVPDGTTQYEVNATITGTWSGVAVLYLNASSNAMSGPTPSGTYYAVELSSGTLTLYSRVSGTVSTLASTTVPCPSTCQIRAIRAAGNQILVYVNGYIYISVTNGAITTGQPGIGMRYGSVTYISEVQLGPLDRVAPNAFNPSYIGTSSFPNRVDIQWPGVTDDTNGTGVAFYSIYRNGSFMANVEAPSTTYSDTTVSAGASYSYELYAFDYHLNSVNTTIAVTAAPTGAIDSRRVGLRPTAEYWGANPEQIDMLSGNLNFSVPFLNAVGRGGANGGNWTAGLSLSYNSQNWRNDPGGNWNLGRDVGYGYGWKLLAGSITPAWSGYFTLDHYTFTDASGAEYRLTQNTGGVWTSTESNYVSYNSTTQTLYFRDGMNWVMGCVSAGSEQDSGTLYPTLLNDASTNSGNSITISYMAGAGLSSSNSSSRIYQIFDLRAPTSPANSTYTFSYTTVSGAPHLQSIINNIGTGEAYTFGMTTQALVSPFDGTAFGNEAILGSVNVTNIPGTQQTFTYNTSGELTQSVLPKGGYIAWAYGNFTYSGSRIQREVQTRYLSKDGTLGSQTSYPITHEASDGLHTVHAWSILDDPGGVGEKYWAFSQSGANLGLTTQYQGRNLPGPVVKIQNDYTWVQDSTGNNYIGTVLTTYDPGVNQAVMQKSQTMDIHGNVTQTQIYNYGNLSTPARTYNYTYTGGTFFPPRYIFNRLATATVTEGSTTVTLVTNGYSMAAWLTSSVSLNGSQTFSRDPVSGGILSATVNGLTTTVTLDTPTNSMPAQITVGSLNQSMIYNSFLGLSNETAPNSVTTSFTYDGAARPSTSVSPAPYSITTYYRYPTVNTAASYSTISDPWTLTTSDGFGRTISVAKGAGTYYSGATVVSQVDTVYNSCGCSPLGKMTQTSLPHGPSGPVLWTTYSYDGIGRTVSIQKPDSVSTTTYSYLGNVVTVTDPAGAWKKYTSDALGRLTQVEEPNPGGGSYFTTYSYDMLDHLIGVSMPRPTGTQLRTFIYIDPSTGLPGAFLRSVINPENGTTSYTYDSSNRLSTVIDAKNQKKVMTYDTLNRVTKVQRYVNQSGSWVEDLMQQTNYTYDAGTNGLGRLSGVSYYGGNCTSYNPYSSPAGCDSINESYSYDKPGSMLSKAVGVTRGSYSGSLTTTWTMDSEGRPATVTYPSWKSCPSCSTISGSSYTYAYDTMSRPNTLTDTVNTHTLVSGITYGVANEVQQMTSGYTSAVNTETRTYNSMFQLTELLVGSALDIQYNFSATQNNGKITSQLDVISGEQIAYTYDALNRLASAQTTQVGGTQWGQSYNYDGFGNLTDQNFIKGSVPTLHVTYDSSTNRQTGEAADLNGNIGSGNIYDLENRLVQPSGSTARYGYDANNKRMWRGDTGVDEITFWAGQRLSAYQLSVSGTTVYFTLKTTMVYFGGKLISKGTYNSSGTGDYVSLAPIVADRLGSIGKFYPFGTERPSATGNDTEKFTGYFRDASTGLDYADQRYHQPGVGRFVTPDPYSGSAKGNDPGSMNRYAYTRGDPVNRIDSSGTCDAFDNYSSCGDTADGCYEDYANGFDCETSIAEDPGPANVCPPDQTAFLPGGSGSTSSPCNYWGPPVAPAANVPCDPGFLTVGIGGFSADDINYAARVIFAESSGNAQEDIAMASVIMNRLNNRGFGNQKTLTGVVSVGCALQCQFNAVSDPNNHQFPMSANPGQWQAGSTDCINLTTAIRSMVATVITGPTVPYDSWGAAGTHVGVPIGKSVFFNFGIFQGPVQPRTRPPRPGPKRLI